MKLGFNLSIFNKNVDEVKQEIAEYFSVSDSAIELSLTKASGINDFPFRDIYQELAKFKYISIHLPVISGKDQTKKEFLQYPNNDLEPILNTIKEITNNIPVNTLVVHPDQVTDFNWAKNKFGGLLGFENMDNNKSFGKSIKDMEYVFEKCPNAKWIFDINHLYTNDNSMHSAEAFFNKFKTRLTHYHISAFGGFHSSFIKNPHELVILKGVMDTKYPLIHEGYDYEEHRVKEEYDLIVSALNEK